MKYPKHKKRGNSLAVSASVFAAMRSGHASRATPKPTSAMMPSSVGGNSMTGEDRVADFAREQLARYSEYHAHKESMAYVGFALFAGVIGTILVSGDWPPNAWGIHNKTLALIGLSVAWMALLVYLHFQLRRRRWAALRIIACERVLARWATEDLRSPEDLQAADGPINSKVNWICWFVDIFVPLPGAVEAIKRPKNRSRIYPGAFVRALEEAEQKGTAAIYHEWLMYAMGWLLYLSAMVRTSPADILNISSSLFRFATRLSDRWMAFG